MQQTSDHNCSDRLERQPSTCTHQRRRSSRPPSNFERRRPCPPAHHPYKRSGSPARKCTSKWSHGQREERKRYFMAQQKAAEQEKARHDLNTIERSILPWRWQLRFFENSENLSESCPSLFW